MPQSSESRNPCKKNNPRKKKKLAFMIKLNVLGCSNGSSLTASAPKDRKETRKMKPEKKQRYRPRKAAIDFPDHVFCAPPGIGINASDIVHTTRRNFVPRRNCVRKISSVARRNRGDHFPDITEVLSRGIRSRANHRSAAQIIEMMMLQQDLLPRRNLNADHVSYEETANLNDKIGHVNMGLGEEDLLSCLRISKHLNDEDWRCSICQEGIRKGEEDDIGTLLRCGHKHHLQCLKRWLHLKNECPICKSTAIVKAVT